MQSHTIAVVMHMLPQFIAFQFWRLILNYSILSRCVCVTHSLCIYEKSKQQIALNKMRNVTRINLREVNDDRKKIYFDDLYVDFHRRRRRLNQNQQA